MSAGIEDEPALFAAARTGDAGADAIGGEAALADAPEAVCDKARGDAVLRGLWESPPQSGALLRVLGLCAASGLFAVLCAFAKGALGFWFLAVAVGAPVVEETAKVVLPLMWLEKEPWRFRSVFSIAFTCFCSALVFATIENLLYFHVYIPKDKLTAGIIQYRLTVCTLMHVACTMISVCGLAKAWREAKKSLSAFSAPAVTPYLGVAMVIHGLYNAVAMIFSLAE